VAVKWRTFGSVDRGERVAFDKRSAYLARSREQSGRGGCNNSRLSVVWPSGARNVRSENGAKGMQQCSWIR
jgi:hypothetical protein